MGEQGLPWYVDFFLGDYLKIYANVVTPERTAQEVEIVERAGEYSQHTRRVIVLARKGG